jgi:menaquinone-dependent protoporphyrinogen oxidase
MKTAIIYASKHGTTNKVAHQIKLGFGDHSHLFNIKSDSILNWKEYDTIIIGGSIHAGGIQKRIKDFCNKNKIELINKRIGLFLCCMDEGDASKKHFEKAYPELLRAHSLCNQLVGGEFLMDKMNFFEKAIIKKIFGANQSILNIDHTKVQELIDTMLFK